MIQVYKSVNFLANLTETQSILIDLKLVSQWLKEADLFH